jgi:EAL domain-containing protein (putative c-di-GMP-specific phosphodiesterase class I)
VTIGVHLPPLTPAAIDRGLSLAAVRRLDVAVARGQSIGQLADLVVWDRSGRIVYSSIEVAEGTIPPKEPGLVTALGGRAATMTRRWELDPISGERTGVLDAFEPLIDGHGRVYGAVETALPLRPIEAAATRAQRRVSLYFIGGATIVWLLLLPVWIRLSGSLAADWSPGRRRTLRAMRRALDRNAFELLYQPQINPTTGRVLAVEALVRWRHHGELVSPDRFLPCIESSGLMHRLTDRVLELALQQLAAWRRAGIVTRMSINLSARDLADAALPQRIAAELERYGVLGQDLTLEVTETAILEDDEHARLVLTALNKMGIDIAVDDFGTGHASISRLHGLPVSEVKIDRSFVSDEGSHSRAYLTAMVAFGRSLGLRVVAEGVETAETLTILSTLDCDLAQGYFISRPINAVAMTAWLNAAADSPAQRHSAHLV